MVNFSRTSFAAHDKRSNGAKLIASKRDAYCRNVDMSLSERIIAALDWFYA